MQKWPLGLWFPPLLGFPWISLVGLSGLWRYVLQASQYADKLYHWFFQLTTKMKDTKSYSRQTPFHHCWGQCVGRVRQWLTHGLSRPTKSGQRPLVSGSEARGPVWACIFLVIKITCPFKRWQSIYSTPIWKIIQQSFHKHFLST